MESSRRSIGRKVGQVVIILLLIFAAYGATRLTDDLTREEATGQNVETILAYVCSIADAEEIERQGLLEECKEAQQGNLRDRLPSDDLAGDPKAVEEPDQLPDDDAEPSDLLPPSALANVSTAEIRAQVDAWFRDNPISATPEYTSTIRSATAAYLRANDPSPTEEQIADAVRTVILANPPADGADGAAGRGVASSSLDGCAIVFTYSDGTTERVAPVCGKDPTQEQVNAGVRAYCEANPDVCQGPAGPPGPTCPSGSQVQTVTVETGDSPTSSDTRQIVACVPNSPAPDPDPQPGPDGPLTP